MSVLRVEGSERLRLSILSSIDTGNILPIVDERHPHERRDLCAASGKPTIDMVVDGDGGMGIEEVLDDPFLLERKKVKISEGLKRLRARR